MPTRFLDAWGVVAAFLWLTADPIVDLERRRERIGRDRSFKAGG
jgi:hypothetical protein